MTRTYHLRVPLGVPAFRTGGSTLGNSVPGTVDTVAVQNVYADTVDVPLLVKSASITMDRTWSPYCQVQLVCVMPSSAQLLQLDPRSILRARFQLTQDVDGTAATPQFFDLVLRGISANWGANEVTLTCASDESWAQDFGLMNATAQYAATTGAATDLKTLINNTFPLAANYSDASGSWVNTTGLPSSPAVTDPLWQPGQSWWDYVLPVVEATGNWIYCDEAGVFHLTVPTYVADATARSLTDAANIKDVEETTSRDDPTWSFGAVVGYTPNGGTTTYLISSGSWPDTFRQKVQLVNRSGAKPANSAATALDTRGRARGRNLNVTAMLEIVARPNQTWTVTYAGQSRTGKVQSVTMNLPDGTMSLLVNV